jgi:hypothetical protein
MPSRIRDALYRAIASPRGDSIAPLRITKDLARQLNDMIGTPLATREELEARAVARARLLELRSGTAKGAGEPTDPAPVFLYFETGRNVRELTRMEEVLSAKGIRWTRLDVRGDEATLEFVTRKAECEADDLPVLFVAERPVGNFAAVVASDVSGELARLVFGPKAS